MTQLRLFGYYCQNCRQTVPHTQRTRRFWLCDACWAAVVPAFAQERGAATSEERAQIGAYWGWYAEMEKRYPARRSGRSGLHAARLAPVRSTDDYWPLCECGQERPEFTHIRSASSLFGRARMPYCPACSARRDVEAMQRMAGKIHPDWDDEAWLDALFQTMPAAFALGVLPDYWYMLRRQVAQGET